MVAPFKSNLFRPANPAGGLTMAPGTDDPAQRMARAYYIAGLESAAPINWTSNHLREDQSDYGPIYVAIRVLKEQAAAATMKFYKWHPDAKAGGDEEEKKYLPRDHEICRFFRYPNPQETGRKLIKRMVEQLMLTGTSLNWRVDEGDPDDSTNDKPAEMWNIPTGLYTAVPIGPWYPQGAYRIMPFYPGPYAQIPGTWQAGGIIVPAEQMVVCQMTHPLTYKEALSPTTACAEELDTINAIGRARKSIMRRAPVPSGVVEMDSLAQFPDTPLLNRITQQIYQYIGGPDRAGRPAVLGPGMRWVAQQLQGLELPWGDSWDQLLSFIFAAYGVTKSMVGMNEDTSFAALYAALRQFNLFSLCPLLQDMSDVFDMQIIHRFWGQEYGCEFETQQVSDDDLLEKQLSNDLQAGIRTKNEWRTVRKLKPVEGPEGDEWVKPSGKADQQSQPGQPGQPPSDEPQNPEEKHRPDNDPGEGSLPPRIAGLLGPQKNGNGKH